ncbi:hypothetical protein BST83_00845 [Polaribacter filamentus]|uniref:F5/8 type C domain-containing protein n=1 Tax=Polaribacter filamentus TaxID=53483 RepID=A0A2S7L273_9FLAO|nr:DNRLRE domain-containing protein [Polaribacter filamentus]PQB08936.1 hypothetical protein BST83_00845 [Polaribacter filamentus]
MKHETKLQKKNKTLNMKKLVLLVLFFAIVFVTNAQVSVNSVSEFNTAQSSASSGDTIIWEDGNYSNVDLTLSKNGITLKAETPGGVVFSGNSKARISGDYITFSGFQYRECSEMSVRFAGDHNLATHINMVDNTGYRAMQIDDNTQYNEISYCNIENVRGGSALIQINVSDSQPGYHKVRYTSFLNLPGEGGDYGREPIRIGYYATRLYTSRTTVEYCYFNNTQDADNETMSIKSLENVLRYNTFENNGGGELVFRHGSRNQAYGNFFINTGRGIRVKEGQNHFIYNNYFSTREKPLRIVYSGIDPVDSVHILHNTFYESGTLDIDDDRINNIVFANNIFKRSSGSIVNYSRTFINNIIDGSFGVPVPDGNLQTDPLLEVNGDGYYGLSSSSPAIDASSADYTAIPNIPGIDNDYNLLKDISRQPRPLNKTSKDIGSDEFTSGTITNRPLSLSDVGPSYISRLTICGVTASNDDGNVIENVLDGYSNTHWSSNVNGVEAIFDLCEIYNVKDLSIAWLNGDIRSSLFDIEVSTDNLNWTNVFSGQSGGASVELEDIDIADSDARYVKYIGNGNTVNAWNSITELQIYGDPIYGDPIENGSLLSIDDSYVRGDSGANVNYNGQKLVIKLGTLGEGTIRESFLKFNVSSLPSNTGSAKLRVTVTDTDLNNFEALLVSDNSWSETLITWDNKPLATTTSFGIQSKTTSSSQTLEWDITTAALAQSEVDGFITIKIVGKIADVQSDIASKETATSDAEKPAIVYEEISPSLSICVATASNDDGNVIENVLDGYYNTRWSSNVHGVEAVFDLCEIYNVKDLSIAWFNGDIRSALFDIEVSTDNLNWTNVFSGQSGGASVELEDIDIADSDARYVKYIGNGNTVNAWNSITELQIYGDPIENGSLLSIDDSYVRGDSGANVNYNGQKLVIKLGTLGEGTIRESFLKFDVSSLPSNTGSAKLRVTVTDTDLNNFEALLVSDDSWSETLITWDNKPLATTTSFGIQSKTTSSSQTLEWDITTAALAQSGGDGFITIKIVGKIADVQSDIHSKETANSDAEKPTIIYGSSLGSQKQVLEVLDNTAENILKDLLVYPNPFNDKIFIKNLQNGMDVKIFNSMGQLMMETVYKDYLNISSLHSGMYFLKITDEVNAQSRTIKVIKN